MTGKNFSGNNVTGARRKSDFYETPYSMTEQFLERMSFPRNAPVLEPACGNGAISRVLRACHYDVVEYDQEVNFLTETRRWQTIITNPPYSLAYEFIQQAKAVCDARFAFLLPLSYLHGKKRYDDIYQDLNFPLAQVWIYTRYPMLGDTLRNDGKYRTGMMVYAWYVWDNAHRGKPTIDWIDNHQYVLGART